MSSPNVIGSVISVSMGPPASYRSGYLSLSKVRDAKFYIYVYSYIWYTICRKNTLLKHIISSGKKPREKNEESCNFVWYFPWYVYFSIHSKILSLENYIWVILVEKCRKLNTNICIVINHSATVGITISWIVYWSKIDSIESLYSFHQHLQCTLYIYEYNSVFNIGLVIGRKRTKLTAYISLISIQSTVMCEND